MLILGPPGLPSGNVEEVLGTTTTMTKTVGILARRSQDRPKTGLGWPKICPRPPKMAPEWLQRVPRWPKTGPRQRQDGPRQAQDAARVAREGAKMAQDRPKTGARYLAPASQGLKW